MSGSITYYAATASRLRILARNGHVERVCKIGGLNLDGKIELKRYYQASELPDNR